MMEPKDRRTLHKEAMRGRILQVAEDLFSEEGVEAVSMRKIAAEIDYSPTAIYQHFRNKGEILSAMVESDYRQMVERFAVASGTTGFPVRERLAALVGAFVTFGVENPARYRLWVSNSRPIMGEEGIELEVNGERYPAFQSWLGIIREGMETGEIPHGDPFLVFQLTWAGAHGLVSLLGDYPEFPWAGIDPLVAGLVARVVAFPGPRGFPADEASEGRDRG